MTMRHLYVFVLIAFLFMLVACSKSSKHVVELKRFPIDSMEGIITRGGVRIDKDISSDGNGSLIITSTKPTVMRLFELGDLDIENARLIYQARLRTYNVEGKVYLEMLCHFPGKGEFSLPQDLCLPVLALIQVQEAKFGPGASPFLPYAQVSGNRQALLDAFLRLDKIA